jgi:hypothetical protein
MLNNLAFLKPYFWSYNFAELDVVKHKELIIRQILEYGDKPATDWLLATYSRADIERVLLKTPRSSWGKKSLCYWTSVFEVTPEHATRQVV